MKMSTKYLKILCNLLSMVLIVLLIYFVVPRLIVYFMPFVVGFILALIANPLVKFLEKKIKIKRKYGSAIIIVFVIGGVVLACYGIGVALAAGVRSFMDYLPTMYDNASAEIANAGKQLQHLLDKVPFTQNIHLDEIGATLQEWFSDLVSVSSEPTVSVISDVAKSIPDILLAVVIGLLATYFFIEDREKLTEMCNRHIPQSFREKTGRIYAQIGKAVGGYFKAQFKIMGVIYVILTIGLIILDVKYAWLIAFGIAFLDMLPVFGTGTVLIPWAVIKLFSGNYGIAIGMVILYAVNLVVHQLIQPKLVGESVGMDPFATMVFMFIGYRIKGMLGMIIAIPVGMILINLYEAGAFDKVIWCFKEIARDFHNFCKIDMGKKDIDKKDMDKNDMDKNDIDKNDMK